MSDASTIEISHFYFGSILVPNELRTWLSGDEFAEWGDAVPTTEVQAIRPSEAKSQSMDMPRSQSRNGKSSIQKVYELVESMLNGELEDPLHFGSRPKVQLYRLHNIKSFLDSAQYGDEESIARTLPAILDLVRYGEYRKLKQLGASFFSELSALRTMYPQFSPVLDYVAACAAIAARGDRVLRMTPILLTGAPGVGKTAFSAALAQLVGTTFLKIDMAAAQNSADLAGTSSFWANARPSKLFSLFTTEESSSGEVFGNPVVLIDELDKAAQASAGMQYDPLAPLYSLLEQHSARAYTDQCIGVPLNVSETMFIATANDTAPINPALLSRFKPFHISVESDHARSITLNIINELLDELRHIDIVFHPETINLLNKLNSPREVRQIGFEAMGNALLQDLNIVLPTHVTAKVEGRRSIGFL